MTTPRIFAVDDPAHVEAETLLPWYLNGTLTGSEYTRVHRHVQACVACQRDLNEQDRLRAGFSNEPGDIALEGALSRARGMLDALETGELPDPGLDLTTGTPTRRHYALALAASVLAATTLLAMLLVVSDREAESFRTLANEPAAATAEQQFRIRFNASATDADKRRLLALIKAEIVSGPAADGSYLIATARSNAVSAERLLDNSQLATRINTNKAPAP